MTPVGTVESCSGPTMPLRRDDDATPFCCCRLKELRRVVGANAVDGIGVDNAMNVAAAAARRAVAVVLLLIVNGWI